MDPTALWYTLALGLAACVSLGLAFFSFQRGKEPAALVFGVGNLTLIFYVVGTMFEINADTVAGVMNALSLEYVGIAVVGPLWFLTVWFAKGDGGPLHRKRIALFFVIPVFILIMVLTNQFHWLFYSSVVLTKNGPFTVPVLGKGPLYLINMVYMNMFLALGTLTIIARAISSPPAYRKQYQIMGLSSIFPWGGMVLYQTGLSPWGLDMAPFGLVLSGLTFFIALFRYRLFDLRPLVVEAVFESMGEGVMVLDRDQRLVGINPALEKLVPGLGRGDIGIGRDGLFARYPVLRQLLPLHGPRDGRGGDEAQATLEIEIHGLGGRRIFQVEQSILMDKAQLQRGTIYLFTDVTQRVLLTERMARMAKTDELTGLANRRYFLERGTAEQARSFRYQRPYGVVLFDLDLFKNINDRFGHETGDQALRWVASQAAKALRPTDLLARWGGEEFAILLPETGQEQAMVLAQRVRQALEVQDPALASQGVELSASFGVCGSEKAGTLELELLLRKADAALYEAKAAGRNCVRAALG